MTRELKKEEEKVLAKKHINNLINDPRLNQWEKDFLFSIKQKIITRDLTEKQMSILNKIRQKYVKPNNN